jgi:hypothetical protein
VNEDSAYLQNLCDESHFLAHVRAAFVLQQSIRFVPNEKSKWGEKATRPHQCLPTRRKMLKGAIDELGLEQPPVEQVVDVLRGYHMLADEELQLLEQ